LASAETASAEITMKSFAIGDRVIIRNGHRKGQHAEIIEIQPAKVYKVKLVDGSFLFFSSGGLQQEAGNASGGHNLLSSLQGALRN
jgi:hypothetical protein